MLSRKGSKYLSVYWFVIIFLVAAAVVYMVASFYGKPYDIREIEGNVLINKISDCMVDGGYLNEEFIGLSESEFLDFCHINLNVEDDFGWNNDQIFFRIGVFNFDDSAPDLAGSESFSLVEGNKNIELGCSLKQNFCLERSFYTITKNQEKYIVKIFVAIDKGDKNE